MKLESDHHEPVLVSSADDGYVMPLTVLIKSAALTLSPGSHLRVFVLDGGIGRRNRIRAERSLDTGNVSLTWLPVGAARARLQGVPVFGHVSVATYFRILMGDLLPPEVERAIYVDADAVVLGDLTELWEMPLEGHSLGAVPDGSTVTSGTGIPGVRELGIDPESPRFNGGVLLADLQKWRRTDMASRCVRYLEKYHQQVQFWDQDALNAVLAADWVQLPKRWNYRVDCHVAPPAGLLEESVLAQLRREASIIHYASATKPWHYYADHPGQRLFYATLDQTRWAGWRPPVPLKALKNPHVWGLLLRRVPVVGTLWARLRARRVTKA